MDLNGGRGVDGRDMTLGSVVADTGKISFKNVRVQSGKMESLNAEAMNVSKLELFGKEFPACKGKGGSNGQMHWKTLTLDGANGQELYLVCGDTAASAVDPEPEPETPPTEKKKFLTNLIHCQFKDYPTGCLNCGGYDECLRLNNWGVKNCPSLCSMDTSLQQHYTHSNSIAELMRADFESYPYGCTPGKECSSCVVGKKYAPLGDVMWGKGCANTSGGYGNGSLRTYLLVPYAECIEAESYTPQPDASCKTLSDGGYNGSDKDLQPFEPGAGSLGML